MKYIVDSIVDLINNNISSESLETMVRVDGFEDLNIYNQVAQRLTNENPGKKLEIKLAYNKWNYFKENYKDTSVLNSMETNDWVSTKESITYYRNLHKSDVLVLFGTEDEEDKDGLRDCYSINPDVLIKNLNKNYYKVFKNIDYLLKDDDLKIVNKLYSNLFEYNALDIVKLSAVADSWEGKFDNLEEFIELFYNELPTWGLPKRIQNLPSSGKLNKRKNALKTEYEFINRKKYRDLTKNKLKKITSQINEYNESEESEFNNNWDGWVNQKFQSYDQFTKALIEFIQGRNIEKNKQEFLNFDFAIVEDVLGFKNDDPKKQKNSVKTYTGNPLKVFSEVVFNQLINVINEGKDIDSIVISLNKATLESHYTEVSINDSDEETRELLNSWNNICIHTNGVIEFINREGISLDKEQNENVEISLANNVFNPSHSNGLKLLEDGKLEAASSIQSLTKLEFSIECYKDGEKIKKLSNKFRWQFSEVDSWLQEFTIATSDIICQNEKTIPLAITENIDALLLSKSEEEFFEILQTSEIQLTCDILNFIDLKISETNYISKQRIQSMYNELGVKFVNLMKCIKNQGFYGCFVSSEGRLFTSFTDAYKELGEELINSNIPSNDTWLLDCYIHSFNIEDSADIFIRENSDSKCIVPAWHPAAIEKIVAQKRFFLDALHQWWTSDKKKTSLSLSNVIDEFSEMSLIQNILDIFPKTNNTFYGTKISYGSYSLYVGEAITTRKRLRDIIQKDAVFDDDFIDKEMKKMTDDAKMYYDVIKQYVKAFNQSRNNLKFVFINPTDLQPIVAAVHKYILETEQKTDETITICMNILVEQQNGGGRNYLKYWMDQFFSEDSNVKIQCCLRTYKDVNEVVNMMDDTNDIIFSVNMLKSESYSFKQDTADFNENVTFSTCKFPIVYKPLPASQDTSMKRSIEVSQPQFGASFMHTQVVRYRTRMDDRPGDKRYLAVREISFSGKEEITKRLHEYGYWVVIIDNAMDGALLKKGANSNDYSIIGYSTGKGSYGQYNLTITARPIIVNAITKRFKARLHKLFGWDDEKCNRAARICMNEATSLDGISVLSAINPKDRNVNEFMAYVLTSLRERSRDKKDYDLKVIIHLDSYKHWFDASNTDDDDSNTRPDFLVLKVNDCENGRIKISAKIVECKIATYENRNLHVDRAFRQVKLGLKKLMSAFDPDSTSVRRRYWYSQLYRAIAFAQITNQSYDEKYKRLSVKLRMLLEGDFDIEWSGEVLGFWPDLEGKDEFINSSDLDNVQLVDIPQERMIELLLNEENNCFIPISISQIEEEQVDNEEFETFEDVKNDYENDGESLAKVEDLPEDVVSKQDEYVMETDGNDDHAEMKNEKDLDVATDETSDLNTKSEEIVANSEEIKDEALPKKEHMNLSDIRVLIGEDRVHRKVYWEFGNKGLNNRHLLITGTSGQGKTYAIQTLLYELSKSDISAVVFDYTEGFREDQLSPEFVADMGDKLQENYIYLNGVPINPFTRNEINFAGRIIKEKPADVATRIATILSNVKGFGDQQYAAIFDIAKNGLNKYGDQMDMSKFFLELKQEASKNKYAQSVDSKLSPLFETVEFKPDANFSWDKLLYNDTATLNVFQLSMIDRRIQVVITELMLWDAWYYTQKCGNEKKPFIVVLDEAQNLSHKDGSPSSKILVEGRKFGWSAWFATQSLNVLTDEEVTRLCQAGFRLYFKPSNDEIMKIAKQIDPTNANSWLDPLKTLKKGQCITQGDRIRPDGTFGNVKPTITNVSSFEERKGEE